MHNAPDRYLLLGNANRNKYKCFTYVNCCLLWGGLWVL